MRNNGTAAFKKLEVHLPRHLFSRHSCTYRQQSKTGQPFYLPFHVVGVEHFLPHQLIAAADAQHDSSLTMGTDDGLRHSVAAQFIEVGKGTLATGQDDDIRLRQFVGVVGIEKMHARVAFQHIEIREVAEVAQQNHSYIHLTLLRLQ